MLMKYSAGLMEKFVGKQIVVCKRPPAFASFLFGLQEERVGVVCRVYDQEDPKMIRYAVDTGEDMIFIHPHDELILPASKDIRDENKKQSSPVIDLRLSEGFYRPLASFK